MKILGLIGGMSWESTSLYYRIINTEVKHALGGLHSAQLVMYSFDFAEIVALQNAGDWKQAAAKMTQAGQALKAAGAQALVICTNTMHNIAAEVEKGAGLPLLHIADCTGDEIKRGGMQTVGLIGTRFTMEQPFYRERLEQNTGVRVVVPGESDRMEIHRIIYEELCKGIVRPESRATYEQIILRLKATGAEAIILGCTEIVLLLPEKTCHGLPLLDTTHIHAVHAARYALQSSL